MRAVLLDVFTDRPLTGNQLAVFLDGPSVPVAVRQDLAREIGFSETVYVDPPSHPTAGDCRIRIFTPVTELPFAGHPVLGTAVAVALDRGLGAGSVVTLECGVGPVPVEVDASGVTGSGWMRQPVPSFAAWPDVPALLAALGLAADDVVAPVEVYDNGPTHLMVTVASAAVVAGLTPDLGRLAGLAGTTGTSVCAVSGPASASTRMFSPGMGIAEDPATGSAAGPLGVHLLRHGLLAPGSLLTVTQGVEIQRPSTLLVRVEGLPDAIAAVGVGGSAVIVGDATFRL